MWIKRLMDIIVSCVGIIMLLPLILCIMLVIKCTSEGPVLFRQERLGLHGETFQLIKFRTMVVGAESLGTGLSIETNQDSRITKVGRMLRATSLDELPQLWHVLIGEMSLVGPRPPVSYYPHHFADYSEEQRQRFEVKPGMTGLAQVTVRNAGTWDEKIALDLTYIKQFSIWLDVKIVLKTVVVLMQQQNIYGKTE